MLWFKEMSNQKLNSAPDLKVLPPTSEAFEQHILRAHFQAATVSGEVRSIQIHLLSVPRSVGGRSLKATNILEPIALPPDVTPTPEDVLQMVKCSCHECSTARFTVAAE